MRPLVCQHELRGLVIPALHLAVAGGTPGAKARDGELPAGAGAIRLLTRRDSDCSTGGQ
jgi:hypothetical protein